MVRILSNSIQEVINPIFFCDVFTVIYCNLGTYFGTTVGSCRAILNRGVTGIFQGGGGSHCVKQYRHGVFATEYCRLFA